MPRPMAPQQTDKFAESGGTLWFLTQGSSEKVDEVEGDRHVTLSFAAPQRLEVRHAEGQGDCEPR